MAFRLIEERPPVDTVFDLPGWFGVSAPHIIFGVGAIDRTSTEAKKLGARKVAIISDKGVEKVGLLDKVTRVLEKEKLASETYTDITWEPTLETDRDAGEFLRKGRFDLVIGVGGGTVCDASKVASYLATNSGDVSEYAGFIGEPPSKTWTKNPLPLITIATTAGTGAEVSTGGTIIKRIGATIIKGGVSTPLSPCAAMVDPAMTLTLPPRQSVATAFDGLGHMLQLFLAPRSLPVTDALQLATMKLYYNNIRTVFFNGKDIQARWDLSLASMLWSLGPLYWAGEGFGGRYGLAENINELIGPKYVIPHGVAAATTLPYGIEFALPASVGRLALVAEAFGEDIRSQPPRKAASRVVELVAGLVKDVEMPTSLKELNVPKQDLPELVDYIMKYCLKDATARRPLTTENLTELFNRMWEGTIGPL